MAEKITTFAPGTARQLLRDVRDLTRRPQFGARLAPNRYATNPITTRYGRTTTSPQNPVYPTTGNVVEVELGNYEPSPLTPGSVAAKVFTAYEPRQIVTATSYDSPLPFQGEIVKLFWANGKWWFQHPSFRKATADVAIAPGASGNVSIFDGGSDVGTRTAYYTWADDGGATIDAGDEVWITWRDDEQKWFILPPPGGGSSATIYTQANITSTALSNYWRNDGSGKTTTNIFGFNGTTNAKLKLFPSMSGVVGNALGVAFTVTSNPAAYANNWLVIRQNAFYRITAAFYWSLDLLTQSQAQSLLRVAAHSHTYDDYIDAFAFTNRTTANTTLEVAKLERQIVGAQTYVEVDGIASSTGYTTQELFYASTGNSDYTPTICATVIQYVRVNGVTAAINLFADEWFGNATERRMRIRDVHVGVQQLTQPTAQL